MTAMMEGFRTEAELMRSGKHLIRTALQSLELSVRTRYEVPAPGSVPDLVIFSNERHAIQYVITVEFKLGNWRRAISQAFRHRNFGNEAYVVLDHVRSQAAIGNIEVFRAANVGLVTVDIENSVRVWYYPEPSLPFSSHFSRSVAQSLVAPNKEEALPDLTFTRSVRGGVALASLRAAWGMAQTVPQ